jgi:mono/diheme cytochrome c family protein/glucose/arabinose dehydrogenase
MTLPNLRLRLLLSLNLAASTLMAHALPPLPEGGTLPPKASDKPLRIQPNAGNPKEVIPVPEQFRKPALVYSPELALKSFTVPAGFHVEMVAAEPVVESPVALSFDTRGHMFVVEMQGYMQDLGGNGEELPVGRIKRLKSSKMDGVYDQMTVFADQLVMPRAVMSFGDGVLAVVPPNLIYYRDTNGDGVADEHTIIDEKVGYLGGQPEHMPNTPLWALDNWIYLSQHGTRYKYADGKWIKDSVASRGQWGQSMDDEGRLFSNSNGSLLNVHYLPPSHYARNPRFEKPEGLFVNIMKTGTVWPTAASRGFQSGFRDSLVRSENSTLLNITAACGPGIYRGSLFPPEFHGNAFACEPAGNLVKRMVLSENDGLLSASNAYEQRDFFTSSDERFRPVNVNVGPEGALYVTDMYRGIIQHAYFMTPYLTDYIRVRQLEQPIDRGRIWRVVPDGADPHHVVLPEKPAELVSYLSHANGWVRDNAQRLLVCAGDPSVKPALRELLTKNDRPFARLHAFWTLEGLGEFTITKNSHAVEALRAFFTDADPRLRAAAVRLSGTSMTSELLPLAADQDPKVRGEVAFRLASLPGEEIQNTLMRLAIKSPHPFVSDALTCGYAGREGDLVAALLSHPDLPGNEAALQPLLHNLARCVMAQKRPGQIALLLDLAAKQKFRTPLSKAMLSGIAPDLARLRREPPQRLILLNEEPVLLGLLDADPNKALKDASEGLRLMLAWPGKPGFTPPPPVATLTPNEQELFVKGKELYTTICMGCHQPSGFGAEGIAPPLVDSEWVLGGPDRIVRILLHGLSGPIRVNNRSFTMEMPPLGAALDDQSMAATLTYIRREWGHTASAVSPAQVTAIRGKIGHRTAPWTEGELLAPLSAKN